jgi:hypothetical protein
MTVDAEIRKAWALDQAAEHQLKQVARDLRALAVVPRVAGTKLERECRGLAAELEERAAVIVAAWD